MLKLCSRSHSPLWQMRRGEVERDNEKRNNPNTERPNPERLLLLQPSGGLLYLWRHRESPAPTNHIKRVTVWIVGDGYLHFTLLFNIKLFFTFILILKAIERPWVIHRVLSRYLDITTDFSCQLEIMSIKPTPSWTLQWSLMSDQFHCQPICGTRMSPWLPHDVSEIPPKLQNPVYHCPQWCYWLWSLSWSGGLWIRNEVGNTAGWDTGSWELTQTQSLQPTHHNEHPLRESRHKCFIVTSRVYSTDTTYRKYFMIMNSVCVCGLCCSNLDISVV